MRGLLFTIPVDICAFSFDPHADPHCDPHAERVKECRTGRVRFPPGFFSLSYMTCAIKLPIV